MRKYTVEDRDSGDIVSVENTFDDASRVVLQLEDDDKDCQHFIPTRYFIRRTI